MALRRGKFIAINTYIKKQAKIFLNQLPSLQLKELKKRKKNLNSKLAKEKKYIPQNN